MFIQSVKKLFITHQKQLEIIFIGIVEYSREKLCNWKNNWYFYEYNNIEQSLLLLNYFQLFFLHIKVLKQIFLFVENTEKINLINGYNFKFIRQSWYVHLNIRTTKVINYSEWNTYLKNTSWNQIKKLLKVVA